MKIPENIEHNVKWIEERNKIKVSKFMLKVLSILSKIYGGLHHTEAERIWKAKDFVNTKSVVYHEGVRTLSTFDYSELTKLVLFAHKEGIRISIGTNEDSTRHKNLMIQFANRMGRRSGEMYKKHPTIKQAMVNLE